MAAAIDKQLKSERLKTELITNVSHDIKTPLTSIINYVDLLQHEHTPEQEEEYLAVLKRQAFKLKKLTEDLVEASKATTGNLPVNAVRCSMNELLSQVDGEYGDKLSAADLTLVSVMPDKELFCNVDGALMWRVIDNLLSNICKYAQNGTRVYLTLEKTGGDAVVTIQKHLARGAEHSRRGIDGALCARRQLALDRGKRPRPLHRAELDGAAGWEDVARHRWRPLQGHPPFPDGGVRKIQKGAERRCRSAPFPAPVLDNSAQKQYNNSSELYPETEGEHKHGKR